MSTNRKSKWAWLGCWLLVAGLAGCDGASETLTPGAECVSSDECEESFACVLGRCRFECVGFRECPAGSACFVDPTNSEGGCRVEAEASCSGPSSCPTGTMCIEGTCVQACASSSACGGTACVEGTCEDPALTRVSCDEANYCGSGICGDVECDDDIGVALGDGVTCVVRLSGEVDCAGSDEHGLLGRGPRDPEEEVEPQAYLLAIGLDEPAQRVALGRQHACVGLYDGQVRCWGDGADGQLGAAGEAATLPTLALEGRDDEPVEALVLGARHGCVMRAGGEVDCWGSDAEGQLGDAATHASCSTGPCSAEPVRVELPPVFALAAGGDSTCAIDEAGTVHCWGAVAGSATPATVAGVELASLVAVGGVHACAIDDEGVVLCWGDDTDGAVSGTAGGASGVTEVMVPLPATTIAAGASHTCAVLSDHSVWCWGSAATAQTGQTGSTTGPRAVGGLPKALDMYAGEAHSCARTFDGELWCWGRDADGELADGEPSTSPRATPQRALRTPPGGP